jgi:GT2 family glycosyltransferase
MPIIDVSVIIVNYNTAQLVKKCVESVLCQQNINFEIIVVDNHSSDDSIDVLRQFEACIALIANSDNKGFGRANNQAFRICRGRYVFMLNPDAVCLTETDLFHAVQFMDHHPHCGLAGTRIVNADNKLERTAFLHYPRQTQTSADFSGLPGRLATVLGASMIARRDVFERIHGFDEDFFLYGEETDLCLRIRKLGYTIEYCEQMTVRHIGSASEKGNPREEVVRKKKAGKLLFYKKHYPKSDVLKIVKHDLRHARFHMLRLSLIKRLFGLNVKQENKYRHHRVSLELARQFLNEV